MVYQRALAGNVNITKTRICAVWDGITEAGDLLLGVCELGIFYILIRDKDRLLYVHML